MMRENRVAVPVPDVMGASDLPNGWRGGGLGGGPEGTLPPLERIISISTKPENPGRSAGS